MCIYVDNCSLELSYTFVITCNINLQHIHSYNVQMLLLNYILFYNYITHHTNHIIYSLDLDLRGCQTIHVCYLGACAPFENLCRSTHITASSPKFK